jgi:hypothetical protein
VIFSQPSNFPFGGLFASQDASHGQGNFATAYDDFSFGAAETITGVTWQGGYFNGSPASISDFALQIWSDSGSGPNVSLFSAIIAGNAGETFLGAQFPGLVYAYNATLTTPFLAQAGTTYWLSIVPDIDVPPQWGWQTGTGGDGFFYQDFGGVRIREEGDLAFTLLGTPTAVPEPFSVVLLGSVIGILGIGARWRVMGSVRNSEKT